MTDNELIRLQVIVEEQAKQIVTLEEKLNRLEIKQNITENNLTRLKRILGLI